MLKEKKRNRARRHTLKLFLGLCVMLAAGGFLGRNLAGRVQEVSQKQEIPFAPIVIEEQDVSERYCYTLLAEAERNVYKELLQGIQDGESEIYVHLSDPGRVNEIYRYVLTDYPELFWCDGSTRTTSYTIPEEYSVVEPGYSVSGTELEMRRAQIENAADAFFASVSDELSEYEKIKLVYEYIINTVEYNASAPENQNIYSVFVNRESVCAGYAKATQYLLNRMGIFCTYVTGTVRGGDTHAWNIVRCDGAYYHVDTTWGDPVFLMAENSVPQAEQYINYDYLCCPDQELYRTHTPDDRTQYPACTETTYEYYRMNGMYYEMADREQMMEVLQRSIEAGSSQVSFKYPDQTVYQQARELLFNGVLEEVAQYLGRWYALSSVSYYYQEDEEAARITIFWQYE